MIRAIVTDIEGTTSDIAFVHQVLFPWARQRLPAFIAARQHQPEVAEALDDLRNETGRPRADIDELSVILAAFMDEDRKSTALKALQGMVWREGYLNGNYTGHLYPDVLPALRRWQQQGIALYVYSSGSVAAQQLLFGFSDEGDITGLFKGYFDTRVGAKRETSAYRTIAEKIALPVEQLLFLSDIHQELDAAGEAGWNTVQLIRGEPDLRSRHRQVTTFEQINEELLNP